jgi:cytochrome c551/c552
MAAFAALALVAHSMSGLSADARRGELFARRVCAFCHVVAEGQPARDPDAPSFRSIAESRQFRDSGIEVAARNTANGIGHCQDGKPEGESDADESNAELRKSRIEDSTATPPEYEPKGSEEFRRKFPRHQSLLCDQSSSL